MPYQLINRYELGKRTPDFSIVEKIAEVLDVPTAYFYAKEDDLAEMILNYKYTKKVSVY